ncbi:hypothetical protein YC2023_033299 [Brassica napus]
MGPATRDSALLTVRDLIHEVLGEWNKNLIQALLSFEEERIMRLKPSPKGAPDALKWLGEKLEEYSVKTWYHIEMAEATAEILEDEASPKFELRKTVWNLKLAPKVKMSAWKCLKGIVPVGERLLARHINVDPKCKRCEISESINHLLFHYPFARADWNDIHGQKCLPPTGLTKSPLVPWIMWSLWKGHNKLTFENHAGSPAETLTQAIIAAKEWENAHE